MIAVLFEADAVPEHQARYFQLAAELKPLLAEIDGYAQRTPRSDVVSAYHAPRVAAFQKGETLA